MLLKKSRRNSLESPLRYDSGINLDDVASPRQSLGEDSCNIIRYKHDDISSNKSKKKLDQTNVIKNLKQVLAEDALKRKQLRESFRNFIELKK